MKHALALCLVLSTACGSPKVQPPVVIHQPVTSPAEALHQLVRAQDNFFQMSGRFSMTLDPLVQHGFLPKGTSHVLSGHHPFDGWDFKQTSLPFPDEDVSWCRVARGPQGQVLLAAYTGVWIRHDGLCPLDHESLPPAAPWVRWTPQP